MIRIWVAHEDSSQMTEAKLTKTKWDVWGSLARKQGQLVFRVGRNPGFNLGKVQFDRINGEQQRILKWRIAKDFEINSEGKSSNRFAKEMDVGRKII